MLYAYTEYPFGNKGLYRCRSQRALNWLIGWKVCRGYDCKQCTEAEAFAIAEEMGDGSWRPDIYRNSSGTLEQLPYEYWRTTELEG